MSHAVGSPLVVRFLDQDEPLLITASNQRYLEQSRSYRHTRLVKIGAIAVTVITLSALAVIGCNIGYANEGAKKNYSGQIGYAIAIGLLTAINLITLIASLLLAKKVPYPRAKAEIICQEIKTANSLEKFNNSFGTRIQSLFDSGVVDPKHKSNLRKVLNDFSQNQTPAARRVAITQFKQLHIALLADLPDPNALLIVAV